MRWDGLFADIEGQLAAAAQLDHDAHVAELARAEQGSVSLADRLRGQGDRPVEIQIRGEQRFRGSLRQVADGWLVLATGQHSVLVPMRAVISVAGLGRAARAESSMVRRTISLASCLRALARDRAAVTMFVEGGRGEPGTLVGRIDTVGSDYVDFAPEGSGGASGQRVVAVRLEALLAVRSSA